MARDDTGHRTQDTPRKERQREKRQNTKKPAGNWKVAGFWKRFQPARVGRGYGTRTRRSSSSASSIVIKSTLRRCIYIAWMELTDGLAEVINRSRAFISSTAKDRETHYALRTLLDYFAAIPDSQNVQMKALTDNKAWAKQEKRIFLKHSLETRLVGLCVCSLISIILPVFRVLSFRYHLLYIETTRVPLVPARTRSHRHPAYGTQAARRQDDPHRGAPPREKGVSRAGQHAQGPRHPSHPLAQPPPQSTARPPSKPSSTCSPASCTRRRRTYSTAYSYFLEAFENLSVLGESDGGSGNEGGKGGGKGGGKALEAKYMLLCKVMFNLPEDVNALLTIKLSLRYASSHDVESMRAVASAHQKRDLHAFQGVLREYQVELQSDPTIRTHLAALYDTLFEGNLKKIVKPYSVVEVAYVVEQVRQERQAVETNADFFFLDGKLSKMILDNGVLDQDRGCLVIYDESKADVSLPFLLLVVLC
ncbi:hypothetical protein CVT25_007699 [Psilocybe cyanescens]|uniref:PCI domain-containing protein n=1 Tax=Psilocybe cyanescens TaxID=93625 RepID=A0A409XVL2_PSICY|nr:hypothetical protein CVT25_007699 [Psilocybe cyanescens]